MQACIRDVVPLVSAQRSARLISITAVRMTVAEACPENLPRVLAVVATPVGMRVLVARFFRAQLEVVWTFC